MKERSIPTMKAIDIANIFLELFKFDEEGLTNLKLNKLLYYAQGCSYQRRNKPLFKDDIEGTNVMNIP